MRSRECLKTAEGVILCRKLCRMRSIPGPFRQRLPTKFPTKGWDGGFETVSPPRLPHGEAVRFMESYNATGCTHRGHEPSLMKGLSNFTLSSPEGGEGRAFAAPKRAPAAQAGRGGTSIRWPLSLPSPHSFVVGRGWSVRRSERQVHGQGTPPRLDVNRGHEPVGPRHAGLRR